MSANPNTNNFKETWQNEYQLTHYKTPAYKAIADESLKPSLEKGQKLHRTYDSDFVVENMGGDGGYNNQAWTDSDEYIIINYVKDVSFYIKKLDKFQANLPLQIRKARKAMNNLFLQMDADVLGAAYLGAGSIVDDGSLGGTGGNGIALTTSNVITTFAASETALRLANVIYDPTAAFSGDFKLDRQNNMPVAIISPQVYSLLLQYLGGKTTQLGDNVSNSGYVGKYFGFNLFVSNGLPWTGKLVLATNPTAEDTFTLLSGVTQKIGGSTVQEGLTFEFVAAPADAGEVAIASTAAKTVANLVNALNAPYTLIANTADTGYVPYVQSSLTPTQQKMLSNLTASIDASVNTTLDIQVNGMGNVPVGKSMTAGGNIWTTTAQVQHNIFGVNKSIAVVLQYGPELEILQSNPASGSNNSGRVGMDFVTWFTYGIKVFNDQSPMLVDVQVRTDTMTTAPNATFN
jgi:hypothetical protein